MRDGADHIRLNMAEVSYMSSVGIRVLLKFYKQLQRINGSFAVSNPSEAVKTVLELAGLQALLAAEAAVSGRLRLDSGATLERDGASFEVFDVSPGRGRCAVAWSAIPELLSGSRFAVAALPHAAISRRRPSASVSAPSAADSATARRASASSWSPPVAAAYLPTDGTNVPDYLVSTGALVPELKVLYALVCDGNFAELARFEAKPGAGPVTLSDVVSGVPRGREADAIAAWSWWRNRRA